MEYTKDTKRVVEDLVDRIRANMVNAENQREDIFVDIKRKIDEVYQMMPNNFKAMVEELLYLTNDMEMKTSERNQDTFNQINRVVRDKIESLMENDENMEERENIQTLKNLVLSLIEEKETRSNPANGNKREKGYTKEYSENMETKVDELKRVLERVGTFFMDEDTIMYASQRLNEIKMSAEDLINFEGENQIVLSETVLECLENVERKAGVEHEGKDSVIENEVDSTNTQGTVKLNEDIVSKLQLSEQQIMGILSEMNMRIKELEDMLNDPDMTDKQRESLNIFMRNLCGVRERTENALIFMNQGNVALKISKPIEEQGIQMESEKKAISQEDFVKVYEGVRKRIQNLGGLKNVGRYAKMLGAIEGDVRILEDFSNNFSNPEVDMEGLNKIIGNIKTAMNPNSEVQEIEQTEEKEYQNKSGKEKEEGDFNPFIG